MFHTLLQFLLPHQSLTGQRGTAVTPEELRSMRTSPVRLERAALVQSGVRALDQLVAASSYTASPLLRLAIHRLKYRGIRDLADVLGSLLVTSSRLLPSEPSPVLCPVPLYWVRRFSRGFNQAKLLADAVARARGWQCEEYLTRVRPTGRQVLRNRDERIHAMRGAFRVVAHGPVPQRVILVDDVATTGATLDACADALRGAGVEIVEALVVAQG